MAFFRTRLLEELAAAQSETEARQILRHAEPDIADMEAGAAEQLLAEAADIIREKFAD
jgi:hypothetical protein